MIEPYTYTDLYTLLGAIVRDYGQYGTMTIRSDDGSDVWCLAFSGVPTALLPALAKELEERLCEHDVELCRGVTSQLIVSGKVEVE